MPKGGIPPNEGPSLRQLIDERSGFQAWDAPDIVVEEHLLTPEEREERRLQRRQARLDRAAERQAMMREAITTISLLLIGGYALGVMLIELAFILVPLVFSRFLVFIFAPLIKVLTVRKGEETGLPRWVAVLICLLVIFVFMGILLLIIGLTIKGIIADAHSYVTSFNHAFRGVVQFAERFGYSRDEIYALLPHINIGELAIEVLKALFDLIPQIVLVLLIVVYMLLGLEIDLDDTNKSKLEEMIDAQIRSYILVRTLTRTSFPALAGICDARLHARWPFSPFSLADGLCFLMVWW